MQSVDNLRGVKNILAWSAWYHFFRDNAGKMKKIKLFTLK